MNRVMCVLLLAACAGESGTRWGGSVDTLPNGAVRVTNPAQGLWPDGGGWRLVPDLVLGDLDGPIATTFGTISGLEVDRDGRIYVVDRQANELRIFTASGKHVRSVGRTGGGPGEYQNVNGLLWLHPDSLLVVDQRGQRYTILTRDGEYARSVPRHLGFYGWAFSGGYLDGLVYERSSVGSSDDDRRPVLLGTVVARQATADPAPTEELGAIPTVAGDTVFLPEPEGPLYQALSVRTDRGGMVISTPWAPGAVYHLDTGGALWFGHGSDFRIFRMSRGDTLMEIVLDATPAPVTDAERTAWDESETVQQFRDRGGRIDMGSLPTIKPYFSDFYIDPDGYLWVGVPAVPGEIVFTVFDPGGRYLGRLTVEGVERVTWVPPVVRNNRLHVVGRDDLDVQRVHAFRIEK